MKSMESDGSRLAYSIGCICRFTLIQTNIIFEELTFLMRSSFTRHTKHTHIHVTIPQQEMVKTWESIKENESGELLSPYLEEQRNTRKRLMLKTDGKIIEKGMIRSLYVIIDASNAMDLRCAVK
jgi:hypothetical protein